MSIEPHSYCSITADNVLILKISKTTKNRYKTAKNRNKKDTNIRIQKQICYGKYWDGIGNQFRTFIIKQLLINRHLWDIDYILSQQLLQGRKGF